MRKKFLATSHKRRRLETGPAEAIVGCVVYVCMAASERERRRERLDRAGGRKREWEGKKAREIEWGGTEEASANGRRIDWRPPSSSKKRAMTKIPAALRADDGCGMWPRSSLARQPAIEARRLTLALSEGQMDVPRRKMASQQSRLAAPSPEPASSTGKQRGCTRGDF